MTAAATDLPGPEARVLARRWVQRLSEAEAPVRGAGRAAPQAALVAAVVAAVVRVWVATVMRILVTMLVLVAEPPPLPLLVPLRGHPETSYGDTWRSARCGHRRPPQYREPHNALRRLGIQ